MFIGGLGRLPKPPRLPSGRLRWPTSLFPTWMAGAAVNEWIQISGTTAPSSLHDFCGVAWRDDSQVWAYSAAAGGHAGNTTDNSVYGIRLDVDAPSWSTLRSADSSSGWDTTGATSAHFPNGKPAPRHHYADVFYVPEIGRVMVGGRFWGSGGNDFAVRDGFNVGGGDWDAAATWEDRPSASVGLACRDPATGTLYSTQGYKVSTPATQAFSAFTLSGATVNRGGCAWDSTRGQIYHLSTGDWFSSGSSTVRSAVINVSTGVATAIGFNSSAAWTSFQADAADFLLNALTYDSVGDCFYFYNGNTLTLSGQGARVYKIVPNGTTTWDMSIVSVTGVTPASDANGAQNKLAYIPRWKTLILVVAGASVYAMRVA